MRFFFLFFQFKLKNHQLIMFFSCYEDAITQGTLIMPSTLTALTTQGAKQAFYSDSQGNSRSTKYTWFSFCLHSLDNSRNTRASSHTALITQDSVYSLSRHYSPTASKTHESLNMNSSLTTLISKYEIILLYSIYASTALIIQGH